MAVSRSRPSPPATCDGPLASLLEKIREYNLSGLVTAVVVFVLLDAAVLALNLWTSLKVEADAVAINLAGRQRMLSQRMTKASLQLVTTVETGRQMAAHQELQLSARLFNQTLTAFLAGGIATSGDNREIRIPALDDPAARQLAEEARQVWQPLFTDIAALKAPALHLPHLSDQPIRVARVLTDRNPVLLDLMNRLTSRIETVSHESTRLLRITQIIAFILALGNFFVILKMLLHRYRRLMEKGQYLQQIIDQLAVGVCVLDKKNRIISLNHAAATLLGYSAESLRAQSFDTLLKTEEGLHFGNRPNGEHWVARVEMGHLEVENRPVRIATVQDVTETYYNHRKLEYQAQHDLLTGLPNRRLFEDRLQVALAQVRRQKARLGLALIDMDGFKPINDTYGHAAGDQVLQAFAERLRSCVRESDTVARLGGDEFVCILLHLNSRNDLVRFAQRLFLALQPPVMINGVPLQMRASLGMAIYPQHGKDVAELMHQADEAMYEAKSKRSGYAIAPVMTITPS